MYRNEMLTRLKKGEDSLEVSILKWVDVVKHVDSIEKFGEYEYAVERSGVNCALCEINLFCDTCIVSRRIGQNQCSETPYYDYTDAVTRHDLEAMRLAARKELAFLKGLRKKNVQR